MCDGTYRENYGDAFVGLGIFETVDILGNVIEIVECAFENSSTLKEIRFEGSAPMIGKGTFSFDTVVIYYPEIMSHGQKM